MHYQFLNELERTLPKESKSICDYIRRHIVLRQKSSVNLSQSAISAVLKLWTVKMDEKNNQLFIHEDLYRNLYSGLKQTLTEDRCPKRFVLTLGEILHKELVLQETSVALGGTPKSAPVIQLMHLYMIWADNVKPSFEAMELSPIMTLCYSRLVLHVWLMLLFKKEVKELAYGILDGRFLGIHSGNRSVQDVTWHLTETLSLGLALNCMDSGVKLVKGFFDHRRQTEWHSSEHLEDSDVVSRISKYVDVHQFVEIFSPSRTAKERNSALLLHDMSAHLAQDERSTRAFLSTLRNLMLKIKTFRDVKRIYLTAGFRQIQHQLIRAIRRLLGSGIRNKQEVDLDPDATLREIYRGIYTKYDSFDEQTATPVKPEKTSATETDAVLSEICGRQIVLSVHLLESKSGKKGASRGSSEDKTAGLDQSASDLIDIFISFFGSRSAFFGRFAESLAMNVIKQVKERPLIMPRSDEITSAPTIATPDTVDSTAIGNLSACQLVVSEDSSLMTTSYDHNVQDSILLFNIIKKRMATSVSSGWELKSITAEGGETLDSDSSVGWRARFLACQQLLCDLQRTNGWRQQLMSSKNFQSKATELAIGTANNKVRDDAVFVMSKYAWPFRVEDVMDNTGATDNDSSSSSSSGGALAVLGNVWTMDSAAAVPMAVGQENDPLDSVINSWFDSSTESGVRADCLSGSPVVRAFTELLGQYESAHANQTLLFHGPTSFVTLLMEDDFGRSERTVCLDVVNAQIICLINDRTNTAATSNRRPNCRRSKRTTVSVEDIAETLGLSPFWIATRVESLIRQQLIYKLPDNTLSLSKLPTDSENSIKSTTTTSGTVPARLQFTESVVGEQVGGGNGGGGSDENKEKSLLLNSHLDKTGFPAEENLSHVIVSILRDAEAAHQGIPWGMPPYMIFPEIETRLKRTVPWPEFARALFSLTQNKTLVNRGGNYFFTGSVPAPSTK